VATLVAGCGYPEGSVLAFREASMVRGFRAESAAHRVCWQRGCRDTQRVVQADRGEDSRAAWPQALEPTPRA
ncbi:hypothetical protein WAJ75_20955, partial [Acinetobacter baumannii]